MRRASAAGAATHATYAAWLPWAVLGAAALLRLVYLLDYRAHSIFWDAPLLDAEIYDAWARRLAAGDWLGGREVFTLPPLYPYLLAGLYTLLGRDYSAVYAVQAAMGLVNVHLIHSIGRKVFPGRTALVAASLSVLYGSFMFMESKLMSTTLALTLGLCQMRLLLHAAERQTLAMWGACGALLGITALARPETLLFAPLAGWWIHRVCRHGEGRRGPAAVDQYALAGRQPWFALSVFAVFVIIAVSPATLRNWVVSEDWSPANLVSSQGGVTFYQSNNARARGLYTFLSHDGFSGDPQTQAEEEKAIAEKSLGRPLKRSEVTRYWVRRGLDWIAANPGDFFVLECRKLLRFLGSYEYSTEYILNVERETVWSLWIACLPFAAIAGLAIAGILLQARSGFRAPALLLLLVVVWNLTVVLLFYVSSRYRMPSAPFLLLFAAHAVERIRAGLRGPSRAARAEAWIHAGIALALFLVFHPQVDQSSRIQEANAHYNAGNKYFEKSRYDEALASYRRALAGDHTNWRASYNMGNTLMKLGRREEAIEAWRATLRRNKNMLNARRKLESLGVPP